MLNVALVGLLAGSLAVGGGDNKNPQAGDKPAPVQVPGIFSTSANAPLSPVIAPQTIQDMYAFGIANRETPVRVWASYAFGETAGIYDADGDSQNIQLAGTDGEIETQRAIFGAEIGIPVSLFGFGLAGGAQLVLAQNSFNDDATQTPGNNAPLPAGPGFITAGDDLASGFKLQNVKFYGEARAGAIGLHGGYVLDVGTDRVNLAPNPALGGAVLPQSLANSDGRDAILIGADFDYPNNFVRLYGGVDYYLIQQNATVAPGADGDDILNAILGAGFKVSFIELGAALQIQARLSNPVVGGIGTTPSVGSSTATIAPYLRISPRIIPASIFVKGAVLEEYTDFGYRLGGSNSPRSGFGLTFGLTYGFE